MRRLGLLLTAPLILVSVLSGPSGAVTCDAILHPAPSPGLGGIRELVGVSAESSDDVWVAGRRWEPSYAYSSAFALHWDGAAWSSTRMPHPRKFDIQDLVAFSPSDVWVAGRTQRSTGGDKNHSTIQHWDGTAWSESVLRTGAGSIAWAIDGSGPDDIWVVGQRYRREFTRPVPLVWHYDGGAWARMDVAPPTTGTTAVTALFDVSALAPDDVWAVGRYGATLRTYALHWDGSSWTRVTTPNPGGATVNDELRGVVAIGPNDVWAVGRSDFAPLAMHYDGVGFTTTGLPSSMGQLFDVSGVGSGEVWAVGQVYDSLPPTGPPAAFRWDGSGWSRVSVENVPPEGYFAGVAAVSTGEVTAAGFAFTTGTLISVGCLA